MISQFEKMQLMIAKLHFDAAELLRGYASRVAPHVTSVEIEMIAAALGEISLHEACRAVERMERERE